jgi:translation initiation factor IF-2
MAGKQTVAAPSKANNNVAENLEAVVPILIKTDVAGSLEAVKKEVAKLAKDKLTVRFIAEGVGTITETDIKAATAGTLVLGFNVKVDKSAVNLAEKLKITIQTFDIIYRLSEWLEKELETRRPVSLVEEVFCAASMLIFFCEVRDKLFSAVKLDPVILIFDPSNDPELSESIPDAFEVKEIDPLLCSPKIHSNLREYSSRNFS